MVAGDASGGGGWLRYTGAAIGRVTLGSAPSIALYAGLPPSTLAGGVTVAFGSVWVANFDDGSVTRYALPKP